MAALPNTPQFQDTAAGTLALTWPCLPWTPVSWSVGGLDFSAAVVPASYVVSEYEDLEVVLRVEEAELLAVLGFLKAIRSPARAITFWPDQNVPGTSYSVYLISPAAGERPQIQRNANEDDAAVFSLPITLRKASASVAPWTDPYFPAS